MHFFRFLIIALCVIQAKTNVFNSQSAWNLFKNVHKKQYMNNEEETYRRTIFNNNVAMIDRHNFEASVGLHSYTLKINQFADMTYDEIVRTMKSKIKVKLTTETSVEFDQDISARSSNVSIPAAIDWREKGAVTNVIENQDECASDWAFAANGALEGQHFLKTGKLVRLSAQNLMDCSGKFGNEGCNGGLVNAAFQYIKKNEGVDTQASYPYEAMDGNCRFNRSTVGATATGFINIPRGNETALQIALATVGPIAVAIDDTQTSFYFYSSGVYDEPTCSTTDLAHTIILVGYGTFNNGTTKQDYYIGKNSWSEEWGMKGYIWMSRNKKNQCGIATEASYPLV